MLPVRNGNKFLRYYQCNHNLKGWDKIQRTYECCGLTGWEDWRDITFTMDNDVKLPISCCSIPDGAVGTFYCYNKETVSATGCVNTWGNDIRSHTTTLALTCSILAIIQAVVVGYACFLMVQIKQNRVF